MSRSPDDTGPPVYTGAETTGFVSPAGDSLEGVVDLARVLDLHRPNRYPVRVVGQGLVERAILPRDILIVDTAAEPRNGSVAIVMLDGEVFIAQLAWRRGGWWLRSQHADIAPRQITENAELWGIVMAVVRDRV